ncbi:MAG: 3-hydroxybutyryl-CoA dehydrogenase [Bacteriovorax sp.]|nr:3-hydroxybutyryl-CoA dehydrogenase [Bacteriovorax sp.]
MKINTVVVIGAGTMGQGIAQWFAQQNLIVEMVDQNFEFALMSLDRIHQSFDKLQAAGKLSSSDVTIFKKNLSVKKLDGIDGNADLVIEAIIEDLDVKKKIFKDLDMTMSKYTIFASNTSSFSITQMAQSVSSERKQNFLGLHFFNPATIMKLVEVINGLETNPEISSSLIEWFNDRSKVACLCSDSPGFIVNRIARNFYGEALRAAETFDEVKFREIDKVMREVGGFKMGPFELMDLIGIDVNYSVTDSVYRAFFDEARFKPHRLQKDMVAAGRLGKKTGKGFYNYET